MKAASVLLVAALVGTTSAHAQAAGSGSEHASHHAQAPAAAGAQAAMADGEVRKIDREQGKITLRHGPIANLDMPGMTMVFKVADPKMLGTVKEGDKVRFAAEKVNGAITVTAIEPAAK